MSEEGAIPRHSIVNFQNTRGQGEESKNFQTWDTKDRGLIWHWVLQQPLWKLEFCTWGNYRSSIKTFSVILISNILLPLLTFLGSYWKKLPPNQGRKSRKQKMWNPQDCGESCLSPNQDGGESKEGRDGGRMKQWSACKEKAVARDQGGLLWLQLFQRHIFNPILGFVGHSTILVTNSSSWLN